MPGKMRIVDVTGSVEHAEGVRIPAGPPDLEVGRNLKTLRDAEIWLMHPSNWIRYGTGILYWTNNVPRISKRFAEHLLKNPSDRPGFYSSVIHEQYELKHPKKEKEEDKKDVAE